MTLGPPLFMVWGPPSHGPRSKVFARELGIDLEFVEVTRRRGLLVAPYKYVAQAIRTVALLRRRRPRLLFVQSPPNLAVLAAAFYGRWSRAPYVVDAHSAAMLSPVWTRPRWLNRILFRRAAVTIVTDEHWAVWLESIGARSLVVRDIPTVFPRAEAPELGPGFHVLVVNTFDDDEPLDQVVEAARQTPDATFHVTGRIERNPDKVPASVPPNLRFTGYLADADYYALMAAAGAVACFTTRDHTMQRGACEALSMGRPIITSDWDLLRTYFDRGTVHVPNTAEAIAAAVRKVRDDHPRYLAEVGELAESQRIQWAVARRALEDMVEVDS